jgi:hypothetical protein
MAEETVVSVITVSGACCMPHLARVDRALEKNLQQAVGECGVPVEIGKVTLSAVLAGSDGLAPKQREQVLALFQRHGAGFTPAVIINDKVRFAGGQPSATQLKDAILAVTAAKA